MGSTVSLRALYGTARCGCAAVIALVLIAPPSARAGAEPAPTTIADERLEASYNASADFIKYPALDAYLLQVVRRLQGANADATAFAVRIHALHYSLPYSFVLDNGACYISTGLLERLADEPQLAALIAIPLAAAARLDRSTLSASARQRTMRNLIPNLLLITVTAGLGALPLAKAESKTNADAQARAQAASDAVALGWLAKAGYDPKAAPAALRRLRELLAAEQRTGTGEFSDPATLTTRADSLDGALGPVAPPPESTPPVDPTGKFAKLSFYYAERQAAEDVDAHPASVVPIVDRIEAGQGATGVTTFLRAELTRRNITDPAGIPAAIQAYERCVEHADAPVAAYRELAFLYRQLGDAAHARQNFAAYLAHAPKAADAPIIRTYLETP
jgi:hypothetical protein